MDFCFHFVNESVIIYVYGCVPFKLTFRRITMKKLLSALLVVAMLLMGAAAAGFCAMTEDPARRRRKRRGLRGGRDCRILKGNL